MFRFFVSEKNGEYFTLSKETLSHIKVARTQDREFICTFEKKFYVCILEGDNAKILRTLDENHEFEGKVILAASFIDTKRFEWLIQKAAELGATQLIPVLSNNVSKKIPSDLNKKLIRWNQIALNASEQSFRNVPLEVSDIQKFEDVMKIDVSNKYIAHEKQDSTTPTSFNQDCILLVGPEGGFTDEEVQFATENGFEVVSLGKRILRAETASIFMLSRIN